MTLKTHPLK